jgi:hypothetical protein
MKIQLCTNQCLHNIFNYTKYASKRTEAQMLAYSDIFYFISDFKYTNLNHNIQTPSILLQKILSQPQYQQWKHKKSLILTLTHESWIWICITHEINVFSISEVPFKKQCEIQMKPEDTMEICKMWAPTKIKVLRCRLPDEEKICKYQLTFKILCVWTIKFSRWCKKDFTHI